MAGEVVGVPTETVYGLAASIESETGLKKIFSLKERPFFDPLIVHVNSVDQARKLVTVWPPLAEFLARAFWPGPLTLVLEKAAHVNPLITSGLTTVALRQPAHPTARALIEALGHPIAAPSANKFGKTSPSRAAHVQSEFGVSLKQVIDGGECAIGVESTVVALHQDGLIDEVRILRPGGVTREMLLAVLKKWDRETKIVRASSEASPGSLKHHYMPQIPLVILPIGASAPLTAKNPVELILNTDPAIAARELYSELRRLSESGADLIYVYRPRTPEGGVASGIGEAIWDRLTRAATKEL